MRPFVIYVNMNVKWPRSDPHAQKSCCLLKLNMDVNSVARLALLKLFSQQSIVRHSCCLSSHSRLLQRRIMTFVAYQWRAGRIHVTWPFRLKSHFKRSDTYRIWTTYPSGLGRIWKDRICVVQTVMKRSDTGRIGAKKSELGNFSLHCERSPSWLNERWG